MYRRKLSIEFPNLSTAEDMAMNFDYLRRCKRVRFINDVVYRNRKRNGSVTTTYSNGLFEFLEGLKYVKRFLEPYYSREEIEDALDSSKVYHAILYFMRICNGGNQHDAFMRLYP
jgi:hypothetical protein